MKCIYCGHYHTKVTDSRLTINNQIRRRRECQDCFERFTTYEGNIKSTERGKVERELLTRTEKLLIQIWDKIVVQEEELNDIDKIALEELGADISYYFHRRKR